MLVEGEPTSAAGHCSVFHIDVFRVSSKHSQATIHVLLR